jgi:uncharacterized protein YbjT (DUF2867 family)
LARCLIIGCGCRARGLAARLMERGHTIRGTSRRRDGLAAIESAGAEGVLADPDRVSTLVPALDHVSVACILLGTAAAPETALAALHGTRLEMMLERMLDTTVRGVLYEAAGTVDPALLAAGAARVRTACERSLIPHVVIEADPSDHRAWLDQAVGGVERLLSG